MDMVAVIDWAAARQKEREECAQVVEALAADMPALLLALGEMTAQERRTCYALLGFVAHKIRTRKE